MANHARTPLHLALLASTALAGPALAQDAVDLEPIIVKSSSYETEDSDSYATDLISVGEKAAVSPREVPQSTTVITNAQIKDGGYTALEEALADAPGIMILNNDVGRSSIFSRGYEFDYLYFDGLPAPVSSIYGTQPDLSIVDHVEVLKGPAGLFIGTGEPAGAINMRLKQATSVARKGYYTFSADSNGQYRGEVDVAGALNESGTVRGRAVVAYGDGDSFIDMSENGVTSIYGTLAWDISPDTTLTFSLSHMERDISPYNGLPSYADNSLIWTDVDATTAADWNQFDNETNDAVLALEHRFANGTRLKFSARQSYQDADFLYAYSGSAAASDNTISSLRWLGRDFDQDSLALDVHADIPFFLGGWEANAIVGADWQKVSSTAYQASGVISGSWDLDDWDVSDVARPDVSYTSRTDTETTSKGIYSQLRLKPNDALTLIGGARVSWYEGTSTAYSVSSGTITGTTSEDNYDVSGHVTPFAGMTYDLSPSTTLYASYSEIFIPQSEVDSGGSLLDPVEGQQYEIGVKARVWNAVNVSAALFDLTEVNRPVAVDGESYYVAGEEVRSRGFEAEASGELLEGLHVAAGYTYTDTEYLNGTSEGEIFSTYTPDHMLKLQTMYDIQQGALAGWSVGGRVTVMSSFSSRGIEAPGYGVVDLMTKKSLGNGALVRLGVSNLFDKDYYARVGSTSVFNFRGAPRTFEVAFSKAF
ncbi:TonB-dependent siderophore receptor [Albibacillus kandeliae]|uniref:TonB-dependent siderophore receptor n=1 Tax=Albibacillus kandeliae TaxID=2174228 RepID=UPI000D69BD0B|nr:TonB-dependent siderophore receptor [Albibacillus kandeliae]